MVSAVRILVAIAHYGDTNRRWLERLLDTYESMPFDVDVVILTERPKQFRAAVKTVVGLPTRNPRSLPFAAPELFRDRRDAYDLFVYSEDDTLITEENIRAFLWTADVLPADEIGGFLRFESDRDGEAYVSTAHAHFRWIPSSVRRRAGKLFASFSNEHGAAFLLTKRQLEAALASGGFVVPPHEGRHDMLVSAATDVYTQCGLEKLICIDELERFLLHHLPNRYVGLLGISLEEFREQIEGLGRVAAGELPSYELVDPETRILGARFSKSYYEPADAAFLGLIPREARSVLSIGCGVGLLEESLIRDGIKVTGIPLDAVVGVNAERRGVEVVHGPLENAENSLQGRRFDCVLVSNLLHLFPSPERILNFTHRVLTPGDPLIARVPNLIELGVLRRRLAGVPGYRHLTFDSFERAGIRVLDGEAFGRLAEKSGFRLEAVIPGDQRRVPTWLDNLIPSRLIARELHFVATRS
jgi:SAM-dependent methyltransferase